MSKAVCPVCQKPAIESFLPFCSKGCKMIDLHRWLSDKYRIPGDPVPSEEEIEAGSTESEQ